MDQRTGSVASSSVLVEASSIQNPRSASPAVGRCSFERLRATLSVITVEPVLFLYMLATFMQYSVFQDLVYQKTCRDNYDVAVCHNLSNNPEALKFVQTQASHWILVRQSIGYILNILFYFGLFSGIYSSFDHTFHHCGQLPWLVSDS